MFAAGAVFGAALLRFVGPRAAIQAGPPPGPPPGPIEAITRTLDLDPHQREQLRTVADSHRAELEAIMRETQPKLHTVLEAIENEMTPLLRPDQIEKLQAWRKRRPPLPMPGPGMEEPPPR